MSLVSMITNWYSLGCRTLSLRSVVQDYFITPILTQDSDSFMLRSSQSLWDHNSATHQVDDPCGRYEFKCIGYSVAIWLLILVSGVPMGSPCPRVQQDSVAPSGDRLIFSTPVRWLIFFIPKLMRDVNVVYHAYQWVMSHAKSYWYTEKEYTKNGASWIMKIIE